MKVKAIVFAALLPMPAAAGALSDLLMAPDIFAEAPVGTAVAYSEERTVPAGGSLADVEDGRVRLEVEAGEDGRTLLLVQGGVGEERPVGSYRPRVANPVLLYFLETTVRAMAEATGGSPYYIRNRMREALAAADLGPEGPTRAVTLHPFAADANRARMGEFADLAIRLSFDPGEPARILELSADTPGDGGGYHEHMVLLAEE
jgi:hypothetical protein